MVKLENMKQIQMVDLKSQYIKIKEAVDAGIQEVLDNATFIKGPQIKKFEENLADYLNVKHVIACGNGTDALQIAMMSLGLKQGDEIILPVFTYAATAEVIALLGLIPVMVDVEQDTFCINTKLIESKINSKTKAIVPVHLFGQCANMDEIMRIANKHNLFIIEDNAQALGASFDFAQDDNIVKQKAGTIGNIGTTSFFPSKNLGCYGDGGALMTNDDELAKKIRMICNHGQSVQYIHEIIGVNSRLDSIQAAVLNAKLPHLPSYEKARNEVANWYDELLGNHTNIIIPKRNPKSTHVFHQYTITLRQAQGDRNSIPLKLDEIRNLIREELQKRGIPSMIYYPLALHKQKAFEQFNSNNKQFPIAETLCKTVLSLPIHTEMNKEMAAYICENLLEILG